MDENNRLSRQILRWFLTNPEARDAAKALGGPEKDVESIELGLFGILMDEVGKAPAGLARELAWAGLMEVVDPKRLAEDVVFFLEIEVKEELPF